MNESSDALPQRTRLRHDTPHWVDDGAWFFVTINCAHRGVDQLTSPAVADGLLGSLRKYSEQGKWHVLLALLMPDHLHGVFAFPRTSSPMPAVVRDWKRYTARFLGIQWQEGFFDHRLRSDDEVTAKLRYVVNNPVVKGLCQTAEEWPFKLQATVDGWKMGCG
ncbi:MAG: transposase [Verrucomicrobiaceae bacterium]|nr:transposase [Verrucomicrobiaceae bacterium]